MTNELKLRAVTAVINENKPTAGITLQVMSVCHDIEKTLFRPYTFTEKDREIIQAMALFFFENVETYNSSK